MLILDDLAYLKNIVFDDIFDKMKGFREINIGNAKPGDYIRYIDQNGSINEGKFIHLDVRETYSASYRSAIFGSGFVRWAVSVGGAKFYVENSDASVLETPAEQIKKLETPDEQIKKLETPDEQIKKLETPDEQIKKLETPDEQIKKLETPDEQIKKLEAQLEALQKEKAELNQELAVNQSLFDKANKVCQMKNKDLPQKILDIVDEYKLFDLVSLFRATFGFDVNVEYLNRFQKTISSIKCETNTPIEHTVKIVTVAKSEFKSACLYHEIHLAEIYSSMKSYVAANDVAVFPIDSANPIVIKFNQDI
jgi:hypothetical protein